MRFLGACVGTVVATVAIGGSGPGCGRGTLQADGGGATLTGVGGRPPGGAGGVDGVGSGGAAVLGTGGAGPATGSAGSVNCGGGPIVLVPELRPPAIEFVLDTSASMNGSAVGNCTWGCGGASKWSAVVGGIERVLGTGSAPVIWGLKLMGGADNGCDAGTNDVPAWPNSEADILGALARRTVGGELTTPGNTPTRAAMNAAYLNLFALRVGVNPTMVLITDGAPDCGLNATDPLAPDNTVVEYIANSAEFDVRTFVVGVGYLPPPIDATLSDMARAGGLARPGTPAYRAVSDALGVADAIDELVARTTSCVFSLPPPASDGTTTRDAITVFVDGQRVPRDAQSGWIYSDVEHASIQFQGPVCDGLLAGTYPSPTVTFLCLLK